MSHTKVVGPDGCISVVATAAIATPFVFVRWNPAADNECVIAATGKGGVIGILQEAVTAGAPARIFAQVGGHCPLAFNAANAQAFVPQVPTTGGYATAAADGKNCWAANLVPTGAQYDIVTCVFLGGIQVEDVTWWSTGS